MNASREQVAVGTFVVIAALVLIFVVLSVSGAFGAKGVTHKAFFKYAGGLVAAAPVRYGGFLAGKVERLRVDPADSTRIEIAFSIRPDIPVKTDSVAKITSLGALGESYLEITTGSKDAPLAPPDSVLKSKELVAIADLGDMIGGLVPNIDQVLKNVNDRITELKTTVSNVNDLTGEANRKNITASLQNINGMLADARPKLSATLSNVQTATDKLSPVMTNVQTASEKVSPLLDDLKGTIKEANKTLTNIDVILTENRPDIRGAMENTRKTLDSANQLVTLLQKTMERNAENMDETMMNVREATFNLKEMTDTLKRKPSVLVRGETTKDRQPGATK